MHWGIGDQTFTQYCGEDLGEGLRTEAFDEDYVFWFDFYSDGRGKSTGFKCYVIGEAQEGGSVPTTAGPTEPTTAGPTEPTTASPPTTSGPSGPSGNTIDVNRLDFAILVLKKFNLLLIYGQFLQDRMKQIKVTEM